MCFKLDCGVCKKTSWKGCGNHIPAVLDNVPEADRCTCEQKIGRDGKKYPPMAKPAPAPALAPAEPS